MTDPAARVAVCVTLLGDDPVARRLLIAWPLVAPELKDRALLVAWARAAGVAVSETVRRADALQRHGLCRPDRTVDEEAMKVVSHLAAHELRSTRRTTR
jgi:hypothetical protein